MSTLDEAADIVAAYTHPDLLPRRLTVKLAKLYDAPSSQEKGSRFKIGDSTFSLVPDEDVAEAVHEITHGIEEAHPDVLAACKAFLLKRSEGQPPVDLSTLTHDPFDAGRMVYKDRWKDLGGEHYTGRAYENGTSTEILTTGITRLHKDPAAFAHEDPEFFSFIVKTLRKW